MYKLITNDVSNRLLIVYFHIILLRVQLKEHDCMRHKLKNVIRVNKMLVQQIIYFRKKSGNMIET
ncbi:hypothetical protein HanRHA438_Chr09g0407561 [Helianthus annuus]|nr:hypothetical protein HanRHA438_Chr09g0407561 [Helianthus annuus]